MKVRKSLLALLLLIAMVVSLTACGTTESKAPEANSNAPANAPAATDGNETQGDGGYKIGHNNLGAGVWILDKYQQVSQYYSDALGFELLPANAGFSSDQMIKDIQNQINSGVQGQLYFAAQTTLTPTANELFEKGKVYWAAFNQMVDVKDLDLVNQNPYYCGSVGSDHAAVAASLGTLASEMGFKKAGLIAGAVGDLSSDLRIQGFKEAFEAGGGEVVFTARCSDPSEAAAKSDDMMAAHGDDFDCIYGLNMDYILATIHSAENFGSIDHITFFSSDCDKEGLDYVRSGKMIAHSNMSTDAAFGLALVINALDGHPILDADGKAPYFTVAKPWVIMSETADDYENFWLNEQPIPVEGFQSLLYRYNPDVSYDSFVEFMENYGYDYVMSYHK